LMLPWCLLLICLKALAEFILVKTCIMSQNARTWLLHIFNFRDGWTTLLYLHHLCAKQTPLRFLVKM
jgi:hypothetical protein